MKPAKTIVCVLFLAVFLASAHPAGAEGLPAEGGVLPELSPSFVLPKPRDGAVIIQIFSMYCPYCQRNAPTVNRLYEKILSDPRLRDKLRLVGIGVGNSPFEVDLFRNRYRVAFPLYPDGDYRVHKKLGEPRTPYFIVVKINPDGTHRIVYSRLGEIGDPEAFLNEVLNLTGLKK
ncbi:MAG TPA: TlpA disulfide reductase family protein [Syntrophales bacterium]|nr:TlpA disulfide reductase family protein [Syntrophales bacterium]HOM07928.1 TlpA disulfide reductase family protein [Syntrophales bacterium]HPQ06622.1 TlpA disulfide reductase family protein [Syntrophales bacterium]